MEVEDDAINGEHTDFQEMKLNSCIGNNGFEHKGENRLNGEGFRRSTEMEIESLGHKARIDNRELVGLGNPQINRGKGGDQRPNNRATIIFKEAVLKMRTWMPREVNAEPALFFPLEVAVSFACVFSISQRCCSEAIRLEL
jgi:hypothetical protein